MWCDGEGSGLDELARFDCWCSLAGKGKSSSGSSGSEASAESGEARKSPKEKMDEGW